MKGGLGDLFKQAQAMQENLRKAQEELAGIEVTGSAGGGLVRVVMTCRHDVRRVHIDPGLLQDDAAPASAGGAGGEMAGAAREVLEDLVAAAMNDAVRKAEKASQEKLAGLTSGLALPGLNLPL